MKNKETVMTEQPDHVEAEILALIEAVQRDITKREQLIEHARAAIERVQAQIAAYQKTLDDYRNKQGSGDMRDMGENV